MKQFFGFMDETGVLSSDPKQRFFALGLLKIEKTSLLFEQIKNLKDRYKLNGKFEFKFSNIPSAFVQVVDILIGSVVYRHKIEHGLANETTPKGQLVVYIESKLKDAFSKHNSSSGNFRHQQNLLSTFTIFEPFYFSVYQKRTGS